MNENEIVMKVFYMLWWPG